MGVVVTLRGGEWGVLVWCCDAMFRFDECYQIVAEHRFSFLLIPIYYILTDCCFLGSIILSFIFHDLVMNYVPLKFSFTHGYSCHIIIIPSL